MADFLAIVCLTMWVLLLASVLTMTAIRLLNAKARRRRVVVWWDHPLGMWDYAGPHKITPEQIQAAMGVREFFQALRMHELEQSVRAHQRLRWGIAANAGHRAVSRLPRWVHVQRATSLGSTSAAKLCRDAGFDPDAMVGGEAEEESDV